MKAKVCSAIAMLILAAAPAWADLSVSDYCALTVERLKLSVQSWEAGQRGTLSAQAEAGLWGRYNTTADEYLGFMGRHSNEVNAYLAANSGVKEQVDSLSARVRELISQGDASP